VEDFDFSSLDLQSSDADTKEHKRRSHDGKLQHKTRELAELEAIRLTRVNKTPFIPYKCVHCEGYHVGHDRFIIAVYDALKRGYANNKFLADAEYMGNARLALGYHLHGSILLYLVKDKATNCMVEVEVYSVTREQLDAIDKLMRHPTFYKRVRVDLSTTKLLPGYTPEQQEALFVQAYVIFDPRYTLDTQYIGEKWDDQKKFAPMLKNRESKV
jgi:gamma-glutamylcyclotransferase (GGCT)/AIG2-like uncharacterized protein YtfP